ncbi:AAA domain-containing protein [Saccharolobus sp. E5-1-F]|uniref:AAA domain-containing protein n=1 Tax=Saccharolobus sp. E5-1-F TaxID=2663019 RepID=UPI001EE7D152|nr:AAA domain-containing protein [Sulfolobus sp. E5-1-F]
MDPYKLYYTILNEMEIAKEDIIHYNAEVENYYFSLVVFKTKYANLFEPGDQVLVGNIPGTVISSRGGRLLVKFGKDVHFPKKKVSIRDNELLISYLVQLELLERAFNTGGVVDYVRGFKIFNHNALDLFFKDVELPPLSQRVSVKDVELDEHQNKALNSALDLNDNELLLIIGPPGTGKTRVISKIAEALSSRGEKVLVTSHTNRAVDNVIELLGKRIPNDIVRVGMVEKVSKEVRPFLLTPQVRERARDILSKIELEIEKLLDEISRGNTSPLVYEKLSEELEKRNALISKISEEVLKDVKVVGSTLIKSQLAPLTNISFDTVIIDEASQASITLALLGMVKGRKWVVVGDHNQLPPILKSINDDDEVAKYSSFITLIEKYKHRSL